MHCTTLLLFAEFVRVQGTRMVGIFFARNYATAVCFEDSVLPEIHFNCKFAALLFSCVDVLVEQVAKYREQFVQAVQEVC